MAMSSENVVPIERWQPVRFDADAVRAEADAREQKAQAQIEAAEPEPQEPAIKPPTAAEIEQLLEDSRRAGYAAGYEEGIARVRMEAMNLHSASEQLGQAFSRFESDVADELLSLALEVARQVVRQDLSVNPESVLAVVREALTHLPHQHAQIYLHPDDAELVRKHAGDQIAHAGHRLYDDEAIERGGCMIEASGSQIDAAVSTRWRRVVEQITDHEDWARE